MVKPSSLGFFDVSTGVVAAGRSATAVAALMEGVDMQTVLCAPAGKAVLAIRLGVRPSASSRCMQMHTIEASLTISLLHHARLGIEGWRLGREHAMNASGRA